MSFQERLNEHHGYVSDPQRLRKLRQAVAACVRPGDHVLDLACGTGILGHFALEAGAGHVTLVDETDMIEVARHSMARAGHTDRCTFVNASSFRAALTRPADVILSDNVGYMGVDYGVLHMLADAATRLLRPGGRILPSRLRVYAAPVDRALDPDLLSVWTAPDVPDAFHWVHELAADIKHRLQMPAEALMGPGVQVADLALGSDAPDFAQWSAALPVQRDGTVQGLLCWFQADLAPGVTMTNAPDAPDRIERPQALLPFAQGLAARAGDVLDATLLIRPQDQVWTWKAALGDQRRMQTTWRNQTFATPRARAAAAGDRLALTPEARLLRVVLDLCDGSRTAAEVKQAVARDHPDLMPNPKALLAEVDRILGRCTTRAEAADAADAPHTATTAPIR